MKLPRVLAPKSIDLSVFNEATKTKDPTETTPPGDGLTPMQQELRDKGLITDPAPQKKLPSNLM